MTEVVITEIYTDLTRKTDYFEGWSWFKFNNLRVVLVMTLKFYSCVEKRLKLKVKSVKGN